LIVEERLREHQAEGVKMPEGMPPEHDSEFEEWAPNVWRLTAGLGSKVAST
jgi:hypothetical protein